MTRLRIAAVLIGLFLFSVGIRQPLFNREFTYSWEWLSAHTLMTCQLWAETPSAVHHYNLLYTFPNATDKFIDNLWNSGVADKSGNYYYVSMPHLAFLTPYAFLRVFESRPDLRGLEIFALGVHLLACWLLYILIRELTRTYQASRLAAFTAFNVLLFAPTALFFYQNAVVGSVLVIPYTITVLITSCFLLGELKLPISRAAAWVVQFFALFLGCMTDWQAYFTAFSLMVVALYLSIKRRANHQTCFLIAALCCVAVAAALLTIIAQDSRINGAQAFFATIFGRLRVRAGFDSKEGLGLTTFAYYRGMARFYSAYLQFLCLGIAALWIAWRKDRGATTRILRTCSTPFAVAALAVLIDHLILAHHTAQQSFTTLNGLVPIAIAAGAGVTAYFETSANRQRAARLIAAAMSLCVLVSTAEYYWAYSNRPHPFLTAANAINAVVRPTDGLFAIGDAGFQPDNSAMIPQLLIYVRRNIRVVNSLDEAERIAAANSMPRAVVFHITSDYRVTRVEAIDVNR
jgi:hypothetical protein